IAIFSVRIWAGLQNTPGNGLTMESIGHQFKYEFRYPTLTASVYDDMHVPVDTPISLHVTSVDVIHSFWVPEVRVKYDMVPGLVQTLRFTPTKIGKFRIICTEFCGTNHGNMLATMTIESKADFNKWIAAQASKAAADRSGGGVALASGDAAAGKTAFAAKCSSCHAVAAFDKKIVGPGLAGIAHDSAHPQLVTGKPPTAANIAAILTNGYNGPIGMMPNKAANGLSNKDIADLTAYLLTLK
ncbi:MAG: c-type cytochrome, partial [Candidatus Eremiobacteraeota bacterium]|nr:c-type cytochrome [Candidatus Eremiobacteraeota bacterium]